MHARLMTNQSPMSSKECSFMMSLRKSSRDGGAWELLGDSVELCMCASSPAACPQCTEGLTVHPGCEPANQNALPAGPLMHMLMKPSPCALSLGIKEGFVTNFAAFWHMELLLFYAKATGQRMRKLI